MRVAVLGTGRIGGDLVEKIRRSPHLTCTLVAGRRASSEGLQRAAQHGLRTTDGGIDAVVAQADRYDLVFDATNALAHRGHWEVLSAIGKRVVDLTPSHLGHMVVPTVNGHEAAHHDNINLVTCGGQATIPLLHALATQFPSIAYAELVTTASSPSVGLATRQNLDEYVLTTESAMHQLTGVPRVKCMLNVSPAEPPVDFRNTLSVLLPDADPEALLRTVREAVAKVQRFSNGYRLVAATMLTPERLSVTVAVRGRGDVLPAYAGNLDIINDAAVTVAEGMARRAERP
ncbi:MAG: acetaldehyde dehydrogenase [Myxococcota bacterium]|jgi:acetaldehyde dehydrogenase